MTDLTTMTAPQVESDLSALSDAAEAGPWRYRPRKHDDWGVIRGGSKVFNDEEAGPPVASSRPLWHDYDYDAHRAAGTDPMEPNGRFIVELVNAYREGRLVEPARLQAENKRLRELALQAFTVVDWAVGEGYILKPPFFDPHDIYTPLVIQLGVETAEDARAALNRTDEG